MTTIRRGLLRKAIEGYDKFLGLFPRHAASRRAQVRRGLAELRLKAAEAGGRVGRRGNRQTRRARHQCRGGIRRRGGPPARHLLPKIAERLASRARAQLTATAIAEAQEILALGKRYIPAAEKPLERLGRIEASLALSRVKAATGNQRAKAIAAIDQAVAAADFAAAYRARAALLAAYPDLCRDDELATAVLHISAAEQAAVRWVAKAEPAGKIAAAQPPATPLLAQRQFTAAAPETAGQRGLRRRRRRRLRAWTPPKARSSGGNSSAGTFPAAATAPCPRHSRHNPAATWSWPPRRTAMPPAKSNASRPLPDACNGGSRSYRRFPPIPSSPRTASSWPPSTAAW